eukprot:8546391-Pyramimonas_sp.AAC.1
MVMMMMVMMMMMMTLIRGGGQREEEGARGAVSSKRGPNTTGWFGITILVLEGRPFVLSVWAHPTHIEVVFAWVSPRVLGPSAKGL